MTTLTHTVPSPLLDSQVLNEIRFVSEGLAKGLTAKLASMLGEQLAGKKVSTKTVDRVVAASVPGLLEEEFINGLLVNKAADRQRAMLIHALSTVQVQALEPDVKASLPGVVATGEAEDDDELTSEAAAKLLHVSRTYLNTLADSGAFGEICRTEGHHRRIPRAALLEYKRRRKEQQAKGWDQMVEASVKMGLYDGELDGIPRRARR